MCSVRTVKDVISTDPPDFWPAQQEWLRRYFVFEPATYGLEGLKNLARQYLTMVYSALVLGVSFGSDWLGLNGVSGQGHGTDRRVSGKPTF
jgi:hypothetical protein